MTPILSGKISGKDHHRWQDNPTVRAKYMRHYRHPNKYPPLTEEEMEELNAYGKVLKETVV